MTILYPYRRTMAGAKRLIKEEEHQPKKSKRAALTELSLRWQQHARERAIEEARARLRTVAETELRKKIARERAAIPLLAELPPTLPASIIEQVAFWHGASVRDIVGRPRTDRVVEARYDAIIAVEDNCLIAGRAPSLTDLAHIFRRHHTSILVALRKRGRRLTHYGCSVDASSNA